MYLVFMYFVIPEIRKKMKLVFVDRHQNTEHNSVRGVLD